MRIADLGGPIKQTELVSPSPNDPSEKRGPQEADNSTSRKAKEQRCGHLACVFCSEGLARCLESIKN
jgi:hypothetical protein